jgi:hypothetical protein
MVGGQRRAPDLTGLSGRQFKRATT